LLGTRGQAAELRLQKSRQEVVEIRQQAANSRQHTTCNTQQAAENRHHTVDNWHQTACSGHRQQAANTGSRLEIAENRKQAADL